MPERRATPSPASEAVIERLAEKVHEAWIDYRRSGGWEHGSARDDEARRSPSLVPYAQLPPEEQELDRLTVRRTLQGLEELGYRLELGVHVKADAATRETLLASVDELISRGQPLLAYDRIKPWLAAHPNDAEAALRNATALRRCGALQRALQVLAGMSDAADPDGERRGLLAAVHKELYLRSHQRAGSHARDHLLRAQSLYQQVFEESGHTRYWHGINAATLAVLLGHDELASNLAARALAACDNASDGDLWMLATRAEAELIRGHYDVAAFRYREAVAAAGDRIGDIGSTRRNAMLLLDALDVPDADRRAIDEALRPPGVVLFAGHRLAAPGSDPAAFSPETEQRIRGMIAERLTDVNAGFGFSGAAPGPELLFVEAMLERKPGLATVVLPWPREQFDETHVRPVGGAWQRRYHALFDDRSQLPRAVHHVVHASLSRGADSPLYERFAQQLLFGLARLQALPLRTEVTPLVVWNSGDRADGDHIDELLEQWAAAGVEAADDNVIDVAAKPRTRRRPGRPGSAARRSADARARSAVMAILFADVEDYSRIPEDRLPAFIEFFVGGIGNRLSLLPSQPVNVRRVGDGLLMVFTTVRGAGLCALELVEWASRHSQPAADGETFWSRVGLPREMRIRVALHAGPVFECIDPLTRAVTFEGAHINYAARIEPVTPGNQVYASEAFAALAASWPDPCDDFVCEYVGRTSLAKKVGDYPLYHVRRPG